MRLATLACVLGTLVTGCTGTTFTRTRFDSYGDIDQAGKPTPIVTKVKDVKVFYGTSPAGFSLRDNELKVEPGYGHRILGTVSVSDDDGECSMTDDYGKSRDGSGGYTKANVIADLRAEAMEKGGNAIIYVHSEVSDAAEYEDVCTVIGRGDDLGSGWVVVLSDAPVAPTAAAAATAPAP